MPVLTHSPFVLPFFFLLTWPNPLFLFLNQASKKGAGSFAAKSVFAKTKGLQVTVKRKTKSVTSIEETDSSTPIVHVRKHFPYALDSSNCWHWSYAGLGKNLMIPTLQKNLRAPRGILRPPLLLKSRQRCNRLLRRNPSSLTLMMSHLTSFSRLWKSWSSPQFLGPPVVELGDQPQHRILPKRSTRPRKLWKQP